MGYLMIENKGEAPVAGLLLFGATTKDPSNAKTIGMFGSGTKYAVIVCLRRKLDVLIYSGNTKLSFFTRKQEVGDTEHQEVMVSVDNKAAQSTGATLAFGQYDWGDHIALALREFVSNALDAAGGNEEDIRFEIVDTPRAKAGTTRVFVPWANNHEGRQRLEAFKMEWFLHFRAGYNPSHEGPIRKVTPDSPATFYRRGVLIRRSSRGEASLWDYNLVDYKLDEARNSDEYAMEAMAAKILSADPRKFARTLKALSQESSLWEGRLSSWYLEGSNHAAKLEAMTQEFSPDTVFVTDAMQAAIVQGEGKTPVRVPASWATTIDTIGGPSFAKSVSEDRREGRTILDSVPANIQECADYWGGLIQKHGLSKVEDGDVQNPKVYVFREAGHKLEKLWGFCRQEGADAGIYINELAAEKMLDVTVLEELAHWHSGFRDYTREFQNWLFHLLARMNGRLGVA